MRITSVSGLCTASGLGPGASEVIGNTGYQKSQRGGHADGPDRAGVARGLDLRMTWPARALNSAHSDRRREILRLLWQGWTWSPTGRSGASGLGAGGIEREA